MLTRERDGLQRMVHVLEADLQGGGGTEGPDAGGAASPELAEQLSLRVTELEESRGQLEAERDRWG